MLVNYDPEVDNNSNEQTEKIPDEELCLYFYVAQLNLLGTVEEI